MLSVCLGLEGLPKILNVLCKAMDVECVLGVDKRCAVRALKELQALGGNTRFENLDQREPLKRRQNSLELKSCIFKGVCVAFGDHTRDVETFSVGRTRNSICSMRYWSKPSQFAAFGLGKAVVNRFALAVWPCTQKTYPTP